MPRYESKALPFSKELIGISSKTTMIHHDKLYAGYVAKLNEVTDKLVAARDNVELQTAANQSYSELRALRLGETFAANGVYLHEAFFKMLGNAESETDELAHSIREKWESVEKFKTIFSATGMAVRGWVVLAWDTQIGELKIYGSDAHNHGAVWCCIPIIVLDVYEHAYFIDYGSDRAAYIIDFWKNMNWASANELFNKVKNWK